MARILLVAAFVALAMGSFAGIVAAQEAKPEYSQDDPAGDPVLAVVGMPTPVNPPAARNMPYLDLTHFSIDDPHEVYFVFKLKNVAGFARSTAPATTGTAREYVVHYVQFQPPGANTMAIITIYSMIPLGDTNPNSPMGVVRVQLCAAATLEYNYCGFYGSSPLLSFDIHDGEIAIQVPKVDLTRDGPLNKASDARTWPQVLQPGDTLTKVSVVAYYYSALSYVSINGGDGSGRILSFTDRMSNTGDLPPYVLKHGMSAPDLKIQPLQNALVGAEENLVPIQVTNQAANKRLLNVTATYVTGSGEAPWKVSVTPGLALGSGKTANITLRVTPSAKSVTEAETGVIRIAVNIVNEPPRRAVLDAPFLAGPPLDAGHSTLYIHRGISYPLAPGYDISGSEAFFTRFEKDPTSADDQGISTGSINFFALTSVTFTFRIQMADYFGGFHDAFPNAAAIEKGKPIKAHLEFDVPVGFDGDLSLTLETDRGPLTRMEKSQPLVQGTNAVELEGLNVGALDHLGPDVKNVRALITVTAKGPTGYVAGYAATVKPVRLMPKVSKITFPLVREVEVLPRADLPKVALVAAEDREAFVNPGRRVVLEADLRNDEPVAQRIDLSIDNASAAWALQIRPGVRFSLAANQSVHVGVLVDAPENAKEGDALRFQLLAKLAESQEALSGLKYSVVATRGVDLENETFESNADDAKSLDHPPKQSPSLGAVPLLLALGLAAFVARRR